MPDVKKATARNSAVSVGHKDVVLQIFPGLAANFEGVLKSQVK